MKPKLEVNDKIVGRPIRLNRRTLEVKTGKDYAEILFIGDAHFGSREFNQPKFLAMLDYCLKKKIYVLLMGDLLECATRNSIGSGVYFQTHNPQEQYEQMIDWLKPLAQARLILGILTGNHEDRITKDNSINIVKAMARELGVSYLGHACWSLFKVGSQRYSVYALHGRTSARYDGTALLAVERCSVSFNADIFAMAHGHKCVNSYYIRERVVGNQVIQERELIMMTGSFLNYHDSYFESTGGQISKQGSPKAKLMADRHDVSISW